MNMISLFLFLFGVTLIYTGLLASSRDTMTGVAIACIGFIFIVKPALDAIKYYRANFTVSPIPNRTRSPKRPKPRKVHLKIIKPKDDKPTIH